MRAFWRDFHKCHPGFRIAVTEDVKVTSMHRGEHFEEKSGWHTIYRAARLAWVSDAFFAHICYRLRMRLLARGIPILPRILHKISMMTAQMSIGDPVHLHPGIYFPHGQVVLDGLVEIQSGTVIAPWVSIGLVAGDFRGPTIGKQVFIGTGSSLLGPFTVGSGAIVGSGAVVTKDVPENTMVVGIPAKPVGNN